MKAATRILLLLAALPGIGGYTVTGTEKATNASKVNKPSKCGLIGAWQGNITIPDGADGVPAMLSLSFSAKGHDILVRGTADHKPLLMQSAVATCSEFSFVLPQKDASVDVKGKLASDNSSVSGTAQRRDVMTSWTLQRQ